MSFIERILRTMEQIVDALSYWVKILTTIAIGLITILIMTCLIVTVPVWIVPYLVWKRRKDPDNKNVTKTVTKTGN